MIFFNNSQIYPQKICTKFCIAELVKTFIFIMYKNGFINNSKLWFTNKKF